ncbi:MAG: Formylglycine-generating sulfatase enzyme [Parcubacteria group bacterium ADurb.Bin216]|nr:MAG: Formylglycine-generating sulfatase enzyme [Parcubacteria group bacterium ADurb.Bin216]
MKNNIKSFTLIELLVVIAIIGILAGFIIVSMSGASSSANDSRRKADINQLSKAIMIYKTDHPDTLLPTSSGCNIGTDCSNEVMEALGSASILRDPDSTRYYSYSSDGQDYVISSLLSNEDNYFFDSSTGTYSISSSNPPIPGNGVCGVADGTNSYDIPTTGLCTIGEASIVSGTGPWTWDCVGTTTASCSANKMIDGVCGLSADTEHDTIPIINLCSSGTASEVGGNGGISYTWICSGENGGSEDLCEADNSNWVDTGLGFYIMKYEAKIQGNNDGNQTYSSSFVPESRAAGTPWVNISQTNAIVECASLGSGYHLITNAEWTSLARHIAAQPSNWSTGTVGSGVLSRGYSASTTRASDGFADTAPAPTSGTLNDIYNTAVNTVGATGSFSLKRTFDLANGKTIWDIAGNTWEWNSDTCTMGSGVGNWYTSGYIEWDDSNLSDYELEVAGPNPLYTSVYNAGRYYGCDANGNALFRGGSWLDGLNSGLFASYLHFSPSSSLAHLGFRCVK